MEDFSFLKLSMKKQKCLLLWNNFNFLQMRVLEETTYGKMNCKVNFKKSFYSRTFGLLKQWITDINVL